MSIVNMEAHKIKPSFDPLPKYQYQFWFQIK